MTRLFKLAAGMGQPSSRCARLGLAHTGELQKRRYTNSLLFQSWFETEYFDMVSDVLDEPLTKDE